MIGSLYISKSKIRRDLLAIFFTNPRQKYYLRELERILGYSAGSIRRELLKFQKDHLFNTEKVGNLLYYSLNVDHPLFNELKSIVSKTVGVEGRLRKLLRSLKGVGFAFIYGSFAKIKESYLSDIDLLIVGKMDEDKLIKRLDRLEGLLRREVNYKLYSMREFRRDLKEKEPFLKEVLHDKKIFLIGDEDELQRIVEK